MRTRDMSYEQYGMTKAEAKVMKKYCQSMSQEECSELLKCAFDANPEIANELYCSLTMGMSYEKLASIKYIPLRIDDFYGYQRKCLALFNNLPAKNVGITRL